MKQAVWYFALMASMLTFIGGAWGSYSCGASVDWRVSTPFAIVIAGLIINSIVETVMARAEESGAEAEPIGGLDSSDVWVDEGKMVRLTDMSSVVSLKDALVDYKNLKTGARVVSKTTKFSTMVEFVRTGSVFGFSLTNMSGRQLLDGWNTRVKRMNWTKMTAELVELGYMVRDPETKLLFDKNKVMMWIRPAPRPTGWNPSKIPSSGKW
jgi:hypothetical protein